MTAPHSESADTHRHDGNPFAIAHAINSMDSLERLRRAETDGEEHRQSGGRTSLPMLPAAQPSTLP